MPVPSIPWKNERENQKIGEIKLKQNITYDTESLSLQPNLTAHDQKNHRPANGETQQESPVSGGLP